MFRRIKIFAACGFTRQILTSALRIAIVVGSLLNVINQGQGVIAGDAMKWGSFLLNYCVPFCVAWYSASSQALRDRENVRDCL
jgi:hypothetical protein